MGGKNSSRTSWEGKFGETARGLTRKSAVRQGHTESESVPRGHGVSVPRDLRGARSTLLSVLLASRDTIPVRAALPVTSNCRGVTGRCTRLDSVQRALDEAIARMTQTQGPRTPASAIPVQPGRKPRGTGQRRDIARPPRRGRSSAGTDQEEQGHCMQGNQQETEHGIAQAKRQGPHTVPAPV